jgi:hypothetical protein
MMTNPSSRTSVEWSSGPWLLRQHSAWAARLFSTPSQLSKGLNLTYLQLAIVFEEQVLGHEGAMEKFV